MAKFKLKAVADFPLKVAFNAPDGKQYDVIFTAKHVKAKGLFDAIKSASDRDLTDVKFIQEYATGWDLEEEFNEENIRELVELFPGVMAAFVGEYTTALTGHRVKN